MQTPSAQDFSCEVKESAETGGRTRYDVLCQGRLVAGSTEPLKTAVQPLLEPNTRIVIDCSGITRLDSLGLGVLVQLKVSSLHRDRVQLEYVNLSPSVKELFRLTKLMDYLARPDTINYGGDL